MCDSATMSNNLNKVDIAHSDDCDLGSADSLISDSRANDKFTVFEHLRKIKKTWIVSPLLKSKWTR